MCLVSSVLRARSGWCLGYVSCMAFLFVRFATKSAIADVGMEEGATTVWGRAPVLQAHVLLVRVFCKLPVAATKSFF